MGIRSRATVARPLPSKRLFRWPGPTFKSQTFPSVSGSISGITLDSSIVSMHDRLHKQEFLIVPHFQRGYVWKKKDWELLLDDVAAQQGPRPPSGAAGYHFFGPLVLEYLPKGGQRLWRATVIDGGQRLITMTIVACVVRDISQSNGYRQLERRAEGYLLLRGRERHRRLKAKSRDRGSLEALVEGRAKDAKGTIQKAYRFFKKEIPARFGSSQKKLQRFFNTLMKQFKVLEITLEKENSLAVFQGLNARGEPLGHADLIRNNVFLRVSTSAQDDFESRYWAPFEALFDVESTRTKDQINTDDFFYHFLIMKLQKYFPRRDTHRTFARYYPRQGPMTPRQIATQLRGYGSLNRGIHRPKKTRHKELRAALQRFPYLRTNTAMPFLLRMSDWRAADKISSSEMAECLRMIESYLIRRTLLGERTRGYGPTFAEACEIVNPNNVTRSLHAFLVKKKPWPSDASVKAVLPDFKVYQKDKKKAHLILWEMERAFKPEVPAPIDELSVERLMPEKPGDEWQAMLGHDWKNVYREFLQTFGNLTLAGKGQNSRLKNKPFAAKKVDLANHGVLKINEYIVGLDSWDEGAMREHYKRLESHLLQTWRGP